MFTLIVLVSSLYNYNAGFEHIKIENLSQEACFQERARFAVGSENHGGNRKGYVVEFSDCVPQGGK